MGLRSFFSFFRNFYFKDADPLPSAIFRIGFSIVQICEIAFLLKMYPLMVSSEAHQLPSDYNIPAMLWVWVGVVTLLLVGYKTRFVSILNYVITVFAVSTFHGFEYHYDFFMLGAGFLLIFLPSGRDLSIDRIISTVRGTKRIGQPFARQSIPYLIPMVIIVAGPALVYFDSVFTKLASPYWVSGFGIWYPASIANIGCVDAQWLLDSKPIMYLLGYGSFLFETTFIFGMWFRKTRLVFFLAGAAMHLFIAIIFPLPLFGLGFFFCLFLMLQGHQMRALFSRLATSKTKRIRLEYNAADPLQAGWAGFLSALDWFRRFDIVAGNAWHLAINQSSDVTSASLALARTFPGVLLSPFLRLPFVKKRLELWLETSQEPSSEPSEKRKEMLEQRKQRLPSLYVWLLFTLIALQFIYIAPNVATAMHKWGIIPESLVYYSKVLPRYTNKVLRPLWGIGQHPVFVEQHFYEYNHILCLEAVNTSAADPWVPLIERDGTPGRYLMGRTWVYYNFRTCNSTLVNLRNAGLSLSNWAAFWAQEQEVPLANTRFKIMARWQDLPTGFTPGYRESQLNRPWRQVGEIYFSEQLPTFFYSDVDFHFQMLSIEHLPKEFFENPTSPVPPEAYTNGFGFSDTIPFSNWLPAPGAVQPPDTLQRDSL